jgi:3-hydroxyisobutyrate dehydrogenase-like beta-hydroxyacid dehydrogenase
MASSKTPKHSFGFVGLGNMGSMMAQNLATYAQHQGMDRVQIWNRTQSKIAHLVESSHVKLASSPDQVAESCDIIHTCVANDEVALSV